MTELTHLSTVHILEKFTRHTAFQICQASVNQVDIIVNFCFLGEKQVELLHQNLFISFR